MRVDESHRNDPVDLAFQLQMVSILTETGTSNINTAQQTFRRAARLVEW
jgi:hypothetical protein